MSNSSAQVRVTSSTGPGPQDRFRSVRLLSFDGGGTRGLSSLLILEEIMQRIKHDEGLSEDPRPCHYFDLIAGTGTGGLIAIMLGRLQMSVSEAIPHYVRLARDVFSETKTFSETTFKEDKLESAIQYLVKSVIKSPFDDGRMLDPRPTYDNCKTFVCAMSASTLGVPHLFRTYPVRDDPSANCFIWEAVRATTAAPTFFKPVSIVDNGLSEVFIDGGLGCVNPVLQLIDEAGRVFPDQAIACIVSIGTGQAETIGLRRSTNQINVLRAMAAHCESVDEQVERRYRSTPGIFFRFNVDQGLQHILAEWNRHPEVTQHTKQYLRKATISKKVDAVVRVIQAQIGGGDMGLVLE